MRTLAFAVASRLNAIFRIVPEQVPRSAAPVPHSEPAVRYSKDSPAFRLEVGGSAPLAWVTVQGVHQSSPLSNVGTSHTDPFGPASPSRPVSNPAPPLPPWPTVIRNSSPNESSVNSTTIVWPRKPRPPLPPADTTRPGLSCRVPPRPPAPPPSIRDPRPSSPFSGFPSCDDIASPGASRRGMRVRVRRSRGAVRLAREMRARGRGVSGQCDRSPPPLARTITVRPNGYGCRTCSHAAQSGPS